MDARGSNEARTTCHHFQYCAPSPGSFSSAYNHRNISPKYIAIFYCIYQHCYKIRHHRQGEKGPGRIAGTGGPINDATIGPTLRVAVHDTCSLVHDRNEAHTESPCMSPWPVHTCMSRQLPKSLPRRLSPSVSQRSPPGKTTNPETAPCAALLYHSPPTSILVRAAIHGHSCGS